METIRDIKHRINSVKNTQKITKAMKMVAASKLRKAQEKAENARPFFNKTREILLNVARYTRDRSIHPLLYQEKNFGQRHLYIVITAERGLCGAYNARVIDKTMEAISNTDEDISLLTIGRKGRDFFKKREYNIISEYIQIDDYPNFNLAERISDEIISLFLEDMIDKVSLIYNHFNSAISQTSRLIDLLPLDTSLGNEVSNQVEYIYEPSPDIVLDILLVNYLTNIFYSALLEAKASEFGARMTAMDSATDNAGELIDKLTLTYNRARQAAITKEISEIVGGAEALK
jgi:F-type H+-transporting ATPase subunit gamma